MALTGPDRVALTYRTQQLVDFKLTNTSASRQKFWVAIDANEQLVQATSSDLRKFYSWPELTAAESVSGQAVTIWQRVARLPATLELAAGQSTQLQLQLFAARHRRMLRISCCEYFQPTTRPATM